LARSRRLVLIAAFALLAATVAARFGASDSQAEFMGNLNAYVSSTPRAIGLQLTDGTVVTSLAPGTYAIHLNDTATVHNFHLTGAGVDMTTGIEETGETDWTVEFTGGGYLYRCDRHPDLAGSFVLGAAAAPPAVSVPPPVVTPPAEIVPSAPSVLTAPVAATSTRTSTGRTTVSGTLRVTLGPKQTLTVTRNGKAVGRLAAGL
jgi:hypothetical protein